MKPGKIPGVSFEEPPRIGNRSDALELLDSMIAHIRKSNAGAPPSFQGGEAYYWPRLEALRDALEREII
jgi:hypothetical protein